MIFKQLIENNVVAKQRLSSLYKFAFVIFYTLLLNACANKPNKTIRFSSVDSLTEWQARGKVLLNNGKDKVSGYFYWHQVGNDYSLFVNSFIGTNILKLEVKNQQATLEADDKTYKSNNPELLIFKLTGNLLPVNSLSNWMIGQAPEGKALDYNQQRLNSFVFTNKQQTWQVSYQAFTQTGLLELPTKMKIKSQQHSIKLNINDWELIR